MCRKNKTSSSSHIKFKFLSNHKDLQYDPWRGFFRPPTLAYFFHQTLTFNPKLILVDTDTRNYQPACVLVRLIARMRNEPTMGSYIWYKIVQFDFLYSKSNGENIFSPMIIRFLSYIWINQISSPMKYIYANIIPAYCNEIFLNLTFELYFDLLNSEMSGENIFSPLVTINLSVKVWLNQCPHVQLLVMLSEV